MMRRWAMAAMFLFLGPATAGIAERPDEIIAENTEAIVYLEVTDSAGGVLDTGTGFIVSHDGYVITAAHVRPENGQTLWAVIGQRQGTRYKLAFREEDAASDTALWQLPASFACRQAVTISTEKVKQLERVLVLGFPGQEDLAPTAVSITNVSSPIGFYKADGMLQSGNSGGPTFNEAGKVIGLVQGGTMPGSNNNDIVPIAAAVALPKKHGVSAGFDTAVPFDQSCYATCRDAAHGIEHWGSQQSWGPVDTGWLPGGHNGQSECSARIASALVDKPGAVIALDEGRNGMWEESKKDLLGHVEYKYFCKGKILTQPVYREMRSAQCGLRR